MAEGAALDLLRARNPCRSREPWSSPRRSTSTMRSSWPRHSAIDSAPSILASTPEGGAPFFSTQPHARSLSLGAANISPAKEGSAGFPFGRAAGRRIDCASAARRDSRPWNQPIRGHIDRLKSSLEGFGVPQTRRSVEPPERVVRWGNAPLSLMNPEEKGGPRPWPTVRGTRLLSHLIDRLGVFLASETIHGFRTPPLAS